LRAGRFVEAHLAAARGAHCGDVELVSPGASSLLSDVVSPVLAVQHPATIDRQPRHSEEDRNHADDEDRRRAALGGTSTAQPQPQLR
jgi:hypothetical protein